MAVIIWRMIQDQDVTDDKEFYHSKSIMGVYMAFLIIEIIAQVILVIALLILTMKLYGAMTVFFKE